MFVGKIHKKNQTNTDLKFKNGVKNFRNNSKRERQNSKTRNKYVP